MELREGEVVYAEGAYEAVTNLVIEDFGNA
jgi:hypothetical protein